MVAPKMKDTVVQAHPNCYSTAKKMMKAIIATNIEIYKYSDCKNVWAPFSILDAVSNNNYY